MFSLRLTDLLMWPWLLLSLQSSKARAGKVTGSKASSSKAAGKKASSSKAAASGAVNDSKPDEVRAACIKCARRILALGLEALLGSAAQLLLSRYALS
jgi:hypothetical protein